MHLTSRQLINVSIAVLALSCMCKSVSAKKTKKHTCPIGFSIAYTREKGHPICYRLKGPELFTDKYKNCVGNLYTSKLYLELNFTSPNTVLWTEFKSLYPGGTFVDWSHTKSMGGELDSSFEVNIDPTIDIGEELCVAIDPISNFTAVKCSDRHYRYCFVKPYSGDDDEDTGCDGLKDAVRFWSPESTCLTVLTGVGGGTVRAMWVQAQELCGKRGGSLLNRGWRYSNYKMFHENGFNNTYPLGIIMDTEQNVLRYDAMNDHSEIPITEWNFEDNNTNVDTLFGSIRDDLWYLVDGSFIFYDVICERNVPIKYLDMVLDIDMDNKITLTVNDTIEGDKIFCYTESETRHPTRVDKSRKDDSNTFIVKPENDGYYWCTHVDLKNYHVAESNRKLFIREKQSLLNMYAVKLRHYRRIKLDIVEKLTRIWEAKLKEFIYLKAKYEGVFGELISNRSEEVLKSFRETNPGLDWKEKSVIEKVKVQRLYLDAQTVLLHVELNQEYGPVSPGYWDGLQILFMKPVYYCRGFDTVPTAALGEIVFSQGCRTHTCVGDFVEGVQWITSATIDCTTTTQTTTTLGTEITSTTELPTTTVTMKKVMERQKSTSHSSSESHEDITDVINTTTSYILPSMPTLIITTNTPEEILTGTPFIPTTTTTTTQKPPEKVLEQVMDDLEHLVNNDSIPIFIQDIDEVFDQVDNLLQDFDDLDIPGRLLHLLDQLGSTIELNGSHVASAVRDNIALVMAEAKPDNPVRGISIAARYNDTFTTDAFQVFGDAPNNTVLQPDENEAVVVLPSSVSDSSRRVSFIVFRNDRAFQDTPTHSVNSRVLSIKVENVTQFEHGEFIDIHLSPLTFDIARNQSRTCGYWKFAEDGTGAWQQDGCTFIRSRSGQLDTCRCTHLTHFAEILVPKTVFPEHHEQMLELLSVIGCCLSLAGLALVGVTAAAFRAWRRDFSNKIWLQLCVAIAMLMVAFLVAVFARFQEPSAWCVAAGVALHYCVLASFGWMLAAAVLAYRRLVLVFARAAPHRLLRAAAAAWGAPVALLGVLLAAAPAAYSAPFHPTAAATSFCYPSGAALWATVYAPIALVVLLNWTLFALIVRSVFASRRIQRHGDSNEALRCASVSCMLVFLFGLPWVFGLFASNLVFAYLFALTASYQGFVLFLFFVVGNKKTRDLWLNKLRIKQTRKVPVTSSTFSNRSTGWRPNTSMEAKASKPKSLSTPDDSRFS